MAADILCEMWHITRPNLTELAITCRGAAVAFVPPESRHAEEVSLAIGALPDVLVALRALVNAEAERLDHSMFAVSPHALARLEAGRRALSKAGG